MKFAVVLLVFAVCGATLAEPKSKQFKFEPRQQGYALLDGLGVKGGVDVEANADGKL